LVTFGYVIERQNSLLGDVLTYLVYFWREGLFLVHNWRSLSVSALSIKGLIFCHKVKDIWRLHRDQITTSMQLDLALTQFGQLNSLCLRHYPIENTVFLIRISVNQTSKLLIELLSYFEW